MERPPRGREYFLSYEQVAHTQLDFARTPRLKSGIASQCAVATDREICSLEKMS